MATNNLSVTIGADTSGLIKNLKEAKDTIQRYKEAADAATKSGKDNAIVTNEQLTAFNRVVNSLDKVASGSQTTAQQSKALAAQIQELKIQWANLSESAKNSDFGRQLSDTLTQAQSQFKTLGEQISQSMGANVTSGTQSVKRELKTLSNELTNLTAQYRALSDAEKQSEGGQALAQRMSEVRARAGELKDTILDVNEEIKHMASDTPNLDVFNELIGVGGSALSAYSSIMAKLTGDEESLKDAIATVMAVQTAANTLTKVSNMLQSQSVVMLKIRKIQELAGAASISIKTAAEGRGIVVTKAATLAQAAFNAVAKANPYVLLASAVIAVITGIVAYTKATKESTDAEKEAQQEAERLAKKKEQQAQATREAAEAEEDEKQAILSGAKAQQTYIDTLKSKTKDLLSSFNRLRAEWNTLSSDSKRNEWIKANANEFRNLGLEINNAQDAERIFNGQTSDFVKGIMKRAQAMAYLAQLAELYQQQIALTDQIESHRQQAQKEAASKPKVKAGDRITDTAEQHQLDQYADQGAMRRTGQMVYSEEGARKHNEGTATSSWDKKMNDKLRGVTDKIQSIANKLKNTDLGNLGGGSGSSNKSGGKNKPDIPESQKAINEFKTTLENIQSLVKDGILTDAEEIDTQTLKAENTLLDKLEANWNKLTDKQKKYYAEIAADTKKLKSERLNRTLEGIKPVSVANTDQFLPTKIKIANKSEMYDSASSMIQDVLKGIEIDILTPEEGRKQIDRINEILQSYKIKPIEVEIQSKSVKGLIKTFDAVGNNINAAADAFSALGSAFDDDPALNVMGIVGQALATVALSFANAMNSCKTWYEWLAFGLTGTATMISMMAQIKSATSGYAQGGIIKGSHMFGDNNYARVNSGEMILNSTQQGRLFNILNGTAPYAATAAQGGIVEFELKGSNLYGSMKNYQKTNPYAKL